MHQGKTLHQVVFRNHACAVVDASGREVFVGTYADCEDRLDAFENARRCEAQAVRRPTWLRNVLHAFAFDGRSRSVTGANH